MKLIKITVLKIEFSLQYIKFYLLKFMNQLIENNCNLDYTWDNTQFYKFRTNKIVAFIDQNEIDYKKSWISFTTHGNFYFSWETGRIKDKINLIKNDNSNIKDINFDNEMHAITFRYEGKWEDESNNEFNIINVNKKCRIYFNHKKHYQIIKLIYEYI